MKILLFRNRELMILEDDEVLEELRRESMLGMVVLYNSVSESRVLIVGCSEFFNGRMCSYGELVRMYYKSEMHAFIPIWSQLPCATYFRDVGAFSFVGMWGVDKNQIQDFRMDVRDALGDVIDSAV